MEYLASRAHAKTRARFLCEPCEVSERAAPLTAPAEARIADLERRLREQTIAAKAAIEDCEAAVERERAAEARAREAEARTREMIAWAKVAEKNNIHEADDLELLAEIEGIVRSGPNGTSPNDQGEPSEDPRGAPPDGWTDTTEAMRAYGYPGVRYAIANAHGVQVFVDDDGLVIRAADGIGDDAYTACHWAPVGVVAHVLAMVTLAPEPPAAPTEPPSTAEIAAAIARGELTLTAAAAPKGAGLEDRSEPPPGYTVVDATWSGAGRWWPRFVPQVGEVPGQAYEERPAAVAACWAHRDAVLALAAADPRDSGLDVAAEVCGLLNAYHRALAQPHGVEYFCAQAQALVANLDALVTAAPSAPQGGPVVA